MNTLLKNLILKYQPQTKKDYENAILEIIQETALLGLWRSKFFDHAAFYGGTSLRILYGLNRFSEDLDFSLLRADPNFDLEPHLKAIQNELEIINLPTTVEKKIKSIENPIKSAFLKSGSLETFIRIGLDKKITQHIQSNEVLKIKIEIDVNPPQDFSTEIKYLLSPIPFSVRSYVPEDLFAGKMHAVLCRSYKVRVKGRDWYDLIWYVKNQIPLHLKHLEARMRQSSHYLSNEKITYEIFVELIKKKIEHLDFESAKEDVRRFISNPSELDVWSKDFFLALVQNIKIK